MNVRGPKSYKDLLTVDGVPCSTFQSKRGLLYRNNSLIECMLEVKFNMFWSKPHSLALPPDSPSRIEES
ncbi:hypothetical protein H5410_014290 [Solanum commersonii]|uniref:Uncharacterized protein n=1 Tax=Solanum commersonii TaxID=4109 RepID=A0A9J5ZQX6_SOLCO|nr:hypothetical protein H5410_014290 [Solanum commersonii]